MSSINASVVCTVAAELLSITVKEAAHLGMDAIRGMPNQPVNGWTVARAIVDLYQERGGSPENADFARQALADNFAKPR